MVGRVRQLGAIAVAGGASLLVGCGGQSGDVAGAGAPAEPADNSACGARVIEDWTDDGRIDGVHRLPCYRVALRVLPEDLRSYTSAVDDIERALFSVHPQAARTSGG